MARAAARVADGGVASDAVPAEDVAAANAFAVRLLRQAAKVQPDVALSPWSVRAVLGLVGVGAAGTTWDELRSVAGFDGDPAVAAGRLGAGTAALAGLEAMSGQSANGLFVGHDTTPLPAYLELATRGAGRHRRVAGLLQGRAGARPHQRLGRREDGPPGSGGACPPAPSSRSPAWWPRMRWR